MAAHRMLAKVCDERDDLASDSLADYYRRLLPGMFDIVAGEELGIATTQTTELLRFSPETAQLARFEAVGLFLDPKSRPIAEAAYNEAVRGSEIYTLDRFGAGALPFDLYVPGVGRGTLRLGTKGGLIMTESPVGFSYKKRPTTTAELAKILQAKFGDGVVLVGKAVSLILMLAKEFVFVFHEGASSYVWRSGQMAKQLAGAGFDLKLNPILRVKYEPWDAMENCCAWLKLPEPLRRPFGTMELSAPSFAVRWKEVAGDQERLLEKMATLKRPLQLVQSLQESMGGHWTCLANEYESMQDDVEELSAQLREVKGKKRVVLKRIRACKAEMNDLFHEKGRHWREKIFEKEPSASDLEAREEIKARIVEKEAEIRQGWTDFKELDFAQQELVDSDRMTRIRDRRKDIALEAEMMRLRLIREAVTASEGLKKAGHRPAAWWFPLVCPDGTWFRATMDSAQYRLEHLG